MGLASSGCMSGEGWRAEQAQHSGLIFMLSQQESQTECWACLGEPGRVLQQRLGGLRITLMCRLLIRQSTVMFPTCRLALSLEAAGTLD